MTQARVNGRPEQLIWIRLAAAALFEVEFALDCFEIAGTKAARANVLKFGDGGIVIFLFLLIEREFRLEFFCQLFVARDPPLELNERRLIIAAEQAAPH